MLAGVIHSSVHYMNRKTCCFTGGAVLPVVGRFLGLGLWQILHGLVLRGAAGARGAAHGGRRLHLQARLAGGSLSDATKIVLRLREWLLAAAASIKRDCLVGPHLGSQLTRNACVLLSCRGPRLRWPPPPTALAVAGRWALRLPVLSDSAARGPTPCSPQGRCADEADADSP